jgi:hypothetical protein
MGFADLSIQDLAAECGLSVESVFELCDRLGVAYKNKATHLALEDAKAIILHILARPSNPNPLNVQMPDRS